MARERERERKSNEILVPLFLLLSCLRLPPSLPSSLPSFLFPSSAGLACKTKYLVDPASSHMLVLKIKPCMSKY